MRRGVIFLAWLALALGARAQQLNPLSISATNSGNQTTATLSWNGTNDVPYWIESSPDLVTWTDIDLAEPNVTAGPGIIGEFPAVVGNGTQLQYVDLPTNSTTKFYRLRTGAIRPGFNAGQLQAQSYYDYGSSVIAQQATGFPLYFNGQTYNWIYIADDGVVAFAAEPAYGAFYWETLPLQSAGVPLISVFGADINDDVYPPPYGYPPTGTITYGNGTVPILSGNTVGIFPAVAVTYGNVAGDGTGGLDGPDPLDRFQIVIIDEGGSNYNGTTFLGNDFDVEFNYEQVQWDISDVAENGSYGYGYLEYGEPIYEDYPRVGITNGANQTIELAGSGVEGTFLDTNETTGLPNYATGLTYATRDSGGIPGRVVFEVRGGNLTGAINANAGSNQTITAAAPTSTILGGNATGGGPFYYAWSVYQAPDTGNSTITFGNQTSTTTSVTLPVSGTYIFELTAQKQADPQVTVSSLVTVNVPN
jgi:hypothetical protein